MVADLGQVGLDQAGVRVALGPQLGVVVLQGLAQLGQFQLGLRLQGVECLGVGFLGLEPVLFPEREEGQWLYKLELDQGPGPGQVQEGGKVLGKGQLELGLLPLVHNI